MSVRVAEHRYEHHANPRAQVLVGDHRHSRPGDDLTHANDHAARASSRRGARCDGPGGRPPTPLSLHRALPKPRCVPTAPEHLLERCARPGTLEGPPDFLARVSEIDDAGDGDAQRVADLLDGRDCAGGRPPWVGATRVQVARALLAGRHIDVLVLGALEHPVAAPALLRELRTATLDPRGCPELPTITLAPLVDD
jgi:hypothetical protein